mmetsp:Transcript_117519/g.175522  ORF Transcript_117519/g.175522 Transcript_117519/m.175522 type:complete len:244 (+) Transcript_117519:397-1128(+)
MPIRRSDPSRTGGTGASFGDGVPANGPCGVACLTSSSSLTSPSPSTLVPMLRESRRTGGTGASASTATSPSISGIPTSRCESRRVGSVGGSSFCSSAFRAKGFSCIMESALGSSDEESSSVVTCSSSGIPTRNSEPRRLGTTGASASIGSLVPDDPVEFGSCLQNPPLSSVSSSSSPMEKSPILAVMDDSKGNPPDRRRLLDDAAPDHHCGDVVWLLPADARAVLSCSANSASTGSSMIEKSP